MIAPGIIGLAFYKRRPSRLQVILGLVATIVLSALLGYISPPGALGSQLASVIAAVIGGVILYVAILAYLIYRYQPKHAKARTPTPPAPAA